MLAQLDWEYVRRSPSRAVVRLWTYVTLEGRPLTTRGRLVNPFVFGGFRLAKRMTHAKPIDRPIIIAGLGRSGTTILGVVLSMHKDVAFLNEPKALWHSVIPYEDVVGNYTRDAAQYRLDERDATEQVIRDARRLFAYSLRMTRRSRVVDKYPEHIFRMPFIRAIFPDARIIFITRDGWNAANSIATWSEQHQLTVKTEQHDWWGANRRKWHIMLRDLVRPDPYYASALDYINALDDDRNMAIVEWIVTMREGLSAMERYPESVLPIRYEDLATTPKSTLQRIQEFCGLSHDAAFSEYGEQTLATQTLHRRFEIPSAIAPLFEDTMRRLGYSSSGSQVEQTPIANR